MSDGSSNDSHGHDAVDGEQNHGQEVLDEEVAIEHQPQGDQQALPVIVPLENERVYFFINTFSHYRLKLAGWPIYFTAAMWE